MRREVKRTANKNSRMKASTAVAAGVITVATVFAVGSFGFGLASADKSVTTSDEFGLTDFSSATASVGVIDEDQVENASSTTSNNTERGIDAQDASIQTSSMGFDISGVATSVEERQERERLAKEESDRLAEIACREKALNARAAWLATSDHAEGIDTVNWNVSKAEFVEEWTKRIDAFLEGSNLAGYGAVFAENAWENGVDPRFSPAISFMESGRASNCFLSHNAWGWGSTGWDSWEEAIATHVKGLADGYGYSLTYSGAQKYCPPNYAVWYPTVCAQIASM